MGAASEKLQAAGPGEVVALARMEGIATGTVLCSGTAPELPRPPLPRPGLRPRRSRPRSATTT